MLNKAILMGRLTGDPELRHTPNNTAVTSFTLAVNRSFGSKGEQQTDFIDIVGWGSTAEFVTKWFRKGMLVAVSGRIQTRNWEDKQGNKRKSVEVVADEVHFAEPKRESASRSDEAPGYGSIPSGSSGFSELSDDDGELPF
ncbi:MAG: single-stranded DNA-binding protein [Bacillota bacterium]|nr:single-stranded DNA-binding protein [Bacillota bacterium]